MGDVDAEDALQVAQRALSKVLELEEQLADAHDRLDEQAERLTEQSLRLSEHDDERAYSDYTLNDKIGMVREHAFHKATTSGGRAKLTYDDVMWEVFEGEPGAKHCYKLLRLAAGDDERGQQSPTDGISGFHVRDPDSGTFHLAVDADLAKQGRSFFPENKTRSQEAR